MSSTLLSRALAAMLATSLAAAPIAIAPMSAAAQTAQPAAEAPTNEEIDSFVLAMVDVRSIAGTYQPRLEGAQSDDEAVRIRQQATSEMAAAVEARGLDVDRYNAIAQAAQEDDELAATIQEKVAGAEKR